MLFLQKYIVLAFLIRATFVLTSQRDEIRRAAVDWFVSEISGPSQDWDSIFSNIPSDSVLSYKSTTSDFGVLPPSVWKTVPIANRVPRNSEGILMPRQRGKKRRLPRPLSRIQALATPPPGPHSRHVRHPEAMPVEDPHHSDDAVTDAVCRSRADSHRSLHQLQLLAIRKFFDESESNFKDKQGNTGEVGSSDTNADRCCQYKQKVHGHPKKVGWPSIQPKYSESQRSVGKIEDESVKVSNSDEGIGVGESTVTKSPLKSTKEGQVDSIGSNDAEWKWKAAYQGAMEKPLTQVRRWCQSPSTVLNRSAIVQPANSGEVSKQKEGYVNSRNKKLPSSNSAIGRLWTQKSTVYGEIPRYSSKVLKGKDLSSEKPNDFISNPSGKEADLPSHTIERAFTDLSPLREAGYRRVMDAVKRFEINIEDASKSTNPGLAPILPTKKRMGLSRDSPVNRRVSHFAQSWNEESKLVTQSLSKYSLNLAENPYARKAQEGEGDQEEETNKHVDSVSVQRIAETPLFDEERSTPPQHYRPVGGIDIYTTQGPKLMQEMKDRFRKKHGASYVESEPKCRPRSSLQTDQPTLPKLEKSLDDVQGLIPLPTNLSSDLSHILPSVLRERPRRPGRLPSRYASQLLPANNPHNRESRNSTEA
ncbi:hypothetical protein TSMEX_002916 [Taenia solium]|eukprot:TsM_000348600 transcript=TsM_000348600 gene=TsM_000348600